MSVHRVWASALALACGMPAFAQEPAAPRSALGWADVAAAIERDPRVAASRSRVRSAEGGAVAVGTPPNPALEVTAGRGKAQQGPEQRTEWGLALSIPLDWLTRRGPEIEAARASVEEAAAQTEALRDEIAAELWRLFVRAGYAQAEAETLEGTEQQVEALARLVRRRVQSGEGRPVEVPRVEVELERARGQVAAARAARDGALAQLGAWLGRAILRVELPPSPSLDEPTVPAGELADHPRVRAALARAHAARAEASVARRSRIPGLTVGAFYANELDRETIGGRIGVELPLWDWKAGPIRRAEATAAAEATRADAERRALAAGFAELAGSCRRARALADRQKAEILPRAEESARTLERAFQLGEAGILDVIDVRRVLLETRREVISSASDRDAECGALVLLSGRQLPPASP